MRGKTVLWLGNLLLILMATLNGHYAYNLTPLLFGIVLLGAYSSFLAVTGGRRPGLSAADESPQPDLPAEQPFVTLLVPAKNEARVIAPTMRELAGLDYVTSEGPQFEIIAIDDGSEDDTYGELVRLAEQIPNLRAVRRERGALPGKSAVLNYGLPLARGDVIGVFDADARVASDFLWRALPPLLQEGVGAVQAQKRISNARPLGSLSGFPLRQALRWVFHLPLLQDIEMLMDTACQTARSKGHGAVDLRGNGLLVKRSALLSVGGWNNETLTDDLDLATRLQVAGWRVVFAPEATVGEEGVRSWPALFRQRRRWVEGCIRRYLDYGGDLVRADIPLALKADALVFVAEFALPMWLFFSVVVWLVSRSAGLYYDPVVSYAIAFGHLAITLPFIITVTWRHVTR
ncbi:MAG: glycosyltransferase family 2 protein, partial [Chloroflexota bacterium]